MFWPAYSSGVRYWVDKRTHIVELPRTLLAKSQTCEMPVALQAKYAHFLYTVQQCSVVRYGDTCTMAQHNNIHSIVFEKRAFGGFKLFVI